ncbi:MAG: daptide-type RiPP [Motilibacteraceae bacterium]
MLNLQIEELEPLEAPGFWEWAAGIAVGGAVGAGLLWAGIALT